MKRERILVVDDFPESLEVVRRNLARHGYVVLVTSNAMDASTLLKREAIDLVITDNRMPQVTGLDLVRHVRENYRSTEVMMITGYASVEGAVEAMKVGADEYLPKPFTEDELLSAVRRALDKLSLRRAAEADPVVATSPPGFIGDSEAMERVYRFIDKAARNMATVLISGESGTGKELVARAIHYGGMRPSAPFVPVNCGGIPESLLESELFGHVKGSFTGATETRAGFFQTADCGTIFLDEVSEMPLSMQVKLLRVLQEREVCMVGSTRSSKVDVRVIAATNKDLGSMVDKGLFREDLFYRLDVISIDLPPLRDRGDDIIKLTRMFAEKFAKEAGRPAPRFSERVLALLAGYHWPGNVRELENTIQRLVLMTDSDIIDASDLPALMRANHLRNGSLSRTLAEVETEYIRNVLTSVEGNKSRAAEILGIDRKTLRAKLKEQPPGD